MHNGISSDIDSLIASTIPELQKLRHYLHQHPELSGQEYKTALHICNFLKQFYPTEILSNLGNGTGVVAIWDSGRPGPVVLFRAELDALPIHEDASSSFPYYSTAPGISHKCGHDGHAAMVAGMAALLHQQPPAKGKVGLLFQPAEETGKGAAALIADERFTNIKPDFIFGLHNLPAFPLGEVVLKEGSFCAASRGMRITLEGKTSHAAEPEKAVTPTACVVSLLQQLPEAPALLEPTGLALLTLTHARIGEPTFGITPGTALVQATLRTFAEDDMIKLVNTCEKIATQEARRHHLDVTIHYEDVFPATANHKQAFQIIQKAAEHVSLQIQYRNEPFRWSEDFGHYAAVAKIGFFGLGAGEEAFNLHHPEFNFPDSLLPYGLRIYKAILDVCMETTNVS